VAFAGIPALVGDSTELDVPAWHAERSSKTQVKKIVMPRLGFVAVFIAFSVV
jgi:hypothetical protein